MLYYNVVCKQKNQVNNRIAASLEHRYVTPISEKQAWTVMGVIRKDV